MTFIEASMPGPAGAIRSSLRVAGEKIVGINCRPRPGDTVIDLEGSLILPGLINAHDHLELNTLPRLKWRGRYQNAGDWIADFQPRFKTDTALKTALAVPLEDRLLIGGIKNLLSGVTTVCHHNPLYAVLRRRFPVRVVRRYRYSHSLLIDDAAVKRTYLKTPADWPWIIHAAEGTDASAAGEFSRLLAWGCIGPNTILVHGVGLGKKEQEALVGRGGGLIWCPSSNHFLLGATADIFMLCRAGRVALGTDSRLSGEFDLLSEMRFAAAHAQVNAADLFRMVTADAAALLRLPYAGTLRPGVPADIAILQCREKEPLECLLTANRSRIRLVLLGGRAQVGDTDMLPVFNSTHVDESGVHVDGMEKLMSRELVNSLRKCAAREPGLEL